MATCLLIDRDDVSRAQVRSMLAAIGVRCAEHAEWPERVPVPYARYDLVFFGNCNEAESRIAQSIRQKSGKPSVFCYFTEHPSIDVVSRLVVNGAADILVMPFDEKLLMFKLAQCGFLPVAVAA
jgi:AmiR/NasT family two-component response regulator